MPCAYNSYSEEADTGRCPGLNGQSVSLIDEPQVPGRDPASTKKVDGA